MEVRVARGDKSKQAKKSVHQPREDTVQEKQEAAVKTPDKTND